jgi:hypothetical protein
MTLFNDNTILFHKTPIPVILTDLNRKSSEHIFVVIVLRKFINDLLEIKEYGINIRNIISFTNVIASNNICMIEIETRRIEESYNNKFNIHPIMYYQLLNKFSNTALQTFRTLLAHDIRDSDFGVLDTLNKWLITTDLDKYKEAIQHVYSDN